MSAGPAKRAAFVLRTIRTIGSGDLENQDAGMSSSGTGNEGVGEHVRTRFHLGIRSPVKLRTSEIRTERRKLVSSAGPVFEKSELFENTIQPFDLMSRRHPLSSTRAIRFGIRFKEANRRDGSCDVPASSRRQFLRSEIYFFFLATLRVFFAVFFTALFAFFAFLAFLAMLPS